MEWTEHQLNSDNSKEEALRLPTWLSALWSWAEWLAPNVAFVDLSGDFSPGCEEWWHLWGIWGRHEWERVSRCWLPKTPGAGQWRTGTPEKPMKQPSKRLSQWYCPLSIRTSEWWVNPRQTGPQGLSLGGLLFLMQKDKQPWNNVLRGTDMSHVWKLWQERYFRRSLRKPRCCLAGSISKGGNGPGPALP